MKSIDHDALMEKVYFHLYKDRYFFKPNEVANAIRMAEKNLNEMKIFEKNLEGKTALNMGTGRESVAFARLGAKFVYHYDISPAPVQALQTLINGDGQFRNISTTRLDMCLPHDLRCDGGVDIVYLVGILQHLHDPETAFRNILRCTNQKARIYLRNYRSGSLNMMVVQFLRKLIARDESDNFSDWFNRRFDHFDINKDKAHTTPLVRLYTSLYDHLFVPILNLYRPQHIEKFLKQFGFSPIATPDYTQYDHEADNRLGGTGISLIFQQQGENQQEHTNYQGELSVRFPSPVDQLNGINYSEQWILDTIDAMNQFNLKDPSRDVDKNYELAVELYHIAFGYALYKFYNLDNVTPEPGFGIAENGKQAHILIQKTLRAYSKPH